MSKLLFNSNGGYGSINEKTWAKWKLDESLADMPDNTAGTTYGVETFATTDSWGIIESGTLAADSGFLVWTPAVDSVQCIIGRVNTDFTGKLLFLKIKYDAKIINVGYRTATAYVMMTKVLVGDTYYCYAIPASCLGTTARILVQYSSPPTDIKFDMVYIGTGARDTNPQDSSGNVNHLTLIGGRSVDGLSGNGLYFDGVASYAKTANLAVIPDTQHFHKSFPFGNTQLTTIQTLFNYKVASDTDGYLFIYRNLSTDNLLVQYCNGSAQVSLTFSAFFTGYTAIRLDVDVSPNWVTGEVKVSRNGVQFGATQTMTTPVKPTAGSPLYIGAYQGTGYYLQGTIDEVRVCDEALTPTDITNMWTYVDDQIATDLVEYSGSAPAMDNLWSLSKAGNVFGGWNTQADGLGIFYRPGDPVAL
jgi:hypothetical protein